MLNVFKRLWYKLSFRNKILLFFFIIMVFPGILTAYSQNSIYDLIVETREDFNSYNEAYELKLEFEENKLLFQEYVRNHDSFTLEKIKQGHQNMTEMVEELETQVYNEKTYIHQVSLEFYLTSFLEESKSAIGLIQNEVGGYYAPFDQAMIASSYFENSIGKLIDDRLSEGNKSFVSMHESVGLINKSFMIGNLIIFILIVFFAIGFASYLAKPIRQLAMASNQMAAGDFDIMVNSHYQDEVGELTNNFIQMNTNIKQLVKDLKKKSHVEKLVYKQNIKNLEMRKSLNEAKYSSLQSQINPHFLFNTLNMIARNAMFEGANKTTKLIESLSKIFRYTLKAKSNSSTLKSEIEVIKEYIEIQNERFGDRISIEFESNLTLDLENTEVPNFIIQPFLENSFVHGLESLEDNGKVRISIKSNENTEIIIKITDNGTGMSKSRLNEILNGLNTNDRGIGVSNVLNRLEIFYHQKCCFIKSKEGWGTMVEIRIPIKNERGGYIV